MDNHPGCFIYDEHILVFIDYIEGYWLRPGSASLVLWLWNKNLHFVPNSEGIAGFTGTAVDKYRSIHDQLPYRCARYVT